MTVIDISAYIRYTAHRIGDQKNEFGCSVGTSVAQTVGVVLVYTGVEVSGTLGAWGRPNIYRFSFQGFP